MLLLGGRPILRRSVEAFLRCSDVHDIVVALPPANASDPPSYLRGGNKPIVIVAGGERRQDSVANAFARVRASAGTDVIVIHDAARPLVSDSLIRRTIQAAARHGAAIAALPVRDTVKRGDAEQMISGTLPRGDLFLAQTPQAFRVDVLRDALKRSAPASEATDEAMLVELAGHRVHLVEGDPRNLKITEPEDLSMAEDLVGDRIPALRIGNGYDLHRLVDGRALILAGVRIPFEKGLQGHSDADAICHAVADALLGAAAAGDIGRHFPDDDMAWKDANSIDLLRRVAALVKGLGFAVVNLDVIVIAQKPKLMPHIEAMTRNLAEALDCAPGQISVKGKTNEGVDSMGAGESIAVHVVALLSQ